MFQILYPTLNPQMNLFPFCSGLTVENLMQFCVTALGHNSDKVREVAERIIKDLYKEVRAPVKDFLPPDNEKTRKITLYRQLFEYFDKVDGKPTKNDVKVRHLNVWELRM